MCLSNCRECKYFNRSPHHRSDIVCTLDPAYANAFKRLESLDEASKSCLPIDDCRDFELDPQLEKKAIALRLNVSDWHKLISVFDNFLDALSQGRFLNHHIKGCYRYQRL